MLRIVFILACVCSGDWVYANDLTRVRAATLTLPVLNPLIMNVMKSRGFDEARGFELELVPYPSIVAMYAGLANGEVDTILGGPTVIQKLSLSGVTLQIIATCVRPSDLVVLTKDTTLMTIEDLRGKTLAADMGTQQFQMVSIYAASIGLNLSTDVTVVNSNFALARSMLEADRVDAAMVIEPIATMMRDQSPKLHTIFNGAAAWNDLTGSQGWELVSVMRADFIAKNADIPARLLAALRDVDQFLDEEPSAADAIAVATTGLPEGVLARALSLRGFQVEVYAAEDERDVLWDMFERAVSAGFLSGLPNRSIIFSP